MKAETVVLRKFLLASREEVFDAWLDAEGMRVWMLPGPVFHCHATLEPYVGGSFHIVMTSPDERVVNTGRFLLLDRPAKLQFTWTSTRWDEQETLVTIELQPSGEGCELTLTHERFPSAHSTAMLVEGWTEIFDKLLRQRAAQRKG